MIWASYFVPHKFGAKSGAETRILRTSTGYYTLENMSDGKENTDTRCSCEDEQQLEKEIDKEIHKFKYFLDETDELIKLRDYTERDIANRREGKIIGKLSNLISQAEELKIDHGVSPWLVRQWKKDVKARYSTFLVDKEKLAKFLNNRQEEIDKEMERKRFETKQEQQREEEHHLTELRLWQEEHERCMWQEKIDAELEATHKWLELEKQARSTTAKLPKLIITLFKWSPAMGEIREHAYHTSPQQIGQHRRKIRLSVWNGQSKRTSKDSKPEAWWNWLQDSLGKTEIWVWPEKTCWEYTSRRNSEPSCHQRIQLLEESGI